MDPAVINTILLTIFGVGGSVLIFRYIGPILSTQERHRIALTGELKELRAKIEAAEREREMLKEMVTQRAQVDDLRQYVKVTTEDAAVTGRSINRAVEDLTRDTADQHQTQTLVLKEMVSVLRGIEHRMSEHRELREPQRGPAGPAGPGGERGEKGDHGQDANG